VVPLIAEQIRLNVASRSSRPLFRCVRRSRTGTPSTHPILRALRRLQRESPAAPFIFVSERLPFHHAGFNEMIERAAAVLARFAFAPNSELCSHAMN
jgi:hypothetical protein